jgi:hypothetical protein
MNLRTLAAVAILAIASPAFAHEVAKGPNGGRVVEAGEYHVELVAAKDTVDVFLTDSADKPVAPTGFKALAILAIGGKSARITLEPADKRLTGKAPGVAADVKGVVQITNPGGKTAQAKFN